MGDFLFSHLKPYWLLPGVMQEMSFENKSRDSALVNPRSTRSFMREIEFWERMLKRENTTMFPSKYINLNQFIFLHFPQAAGPFKGALLHLSDSVPIFFLKK